MHREDIYSMTGQEGYEYDLVCDLDEEALRKYCYRTRELFAHVTRGWSDDKNVEWIARHYLAIKTMLAATVFTTSSRFAFQRNLSVVLPYLNYYSMLNVSRAFLFTLPDVEWKEGELVRLTHKNIINKTAAGLTRLDHDVSESIKGLLNRLRAVRELFSYKFPATGMSVLGSEQISSERIEDACRLLSELSQLNSECLHSSYDKNVTGTYSADFNSLHLAYDYSDDDSEMRLLDHDDWFRISQLCKAARPFSLVNTARPGLTDDFFGAWCSDAEEPDPDDYDPDEDRRTLFQFD